MSVKVYKITRKAYEAYRDTVKGNKNISLDQSRRKLTRNILLAKELPYNSLVKKLQGYKYFQYGNLFILVRHNRIVHIANVLGSTSSDWHFDKKKYIELSKELGITDNKFNK